MRILISEDEPKSREGIIRMIQRFTPHEIVGVAENGEEGFLLAKERQPDLVISDIKMPVLDGLGMLQKMKDHGLKLQAVLLTGYSEFEYARRALQLQVVEYVLKPLEADQFLSALEKAEGRMKKQRAERLTPDQLLWSYYLGGEDERERMRPRVEEELGINDRMISTIFLIRPESIARETYGEIRKQLQQSMEMLCMEPCYFFARQGEDGGVYVLLADTERNRSLKAVFASRILPKVLEITRCVCSMATMRGIGELPRVMERLSGLLRYAFSVPEGRILEEADAAGMVYESIEYPISLENEMIQGIRNGKKARILELNRMFEAQVIDSHASPECIRDYTVRFAVGILRVAGEWKGRWNGSEELSSVTESISKAITRDKVRYQLEKVVKSAAALSDDSGEFQTENGIVLNAISYIRENYQKNIGLGDVAQFCNVRSEYLSRIFKEETGVRFVSFLSNFRISMAKRLLASGNGTVSRVAEQVGFSDQKYFQKVFKKTCGVTPSEYKKENCR